MLSRSAPASLRLSRYSYPVAMARLITSTTPKRERSASSPLTELEPEAPAPKAVKPKRAVRSTKPKNEENKENNNDEDAPTPAKKQRVSKAKAWPPVELEPMFHLPRQGYPAFKLPASTASPNGGIAPSNDKSQPMLLGAHVSAAGGPATALLRAGLAGANGLALFVKSQRQWKSKPYEDDTVQRFKELMKSKEEGGMGYGPDSILVHGSYLINLGNPDPAKWKVSYECFKDDIARCHQLGIKLYNWHPGSTVGACTKEESFALIAKAINQVHKDVPEVITVIENMANAGSNIVGTAWSDLSSIIKLVEDKSRVRVCIDTCHTFAAGYDIRTAETYAETMRKFDEVVGNKYLAGVHLNDSKAGLGANKDLHENIGLGMIGLTAFRCIMRDPLMAGIPLVLETPAPDAPTPAEHLSIWTKEIALLYEIQEIEDDEWEVKKGEIEKRWRKERDAINPPKEKKKPAAKGKAKKIKKVEDDGCSHDED
ncbi:AP endonuclease 1 [Cryptococcus neoformans A2-102-5]|uniref:Apurinic-apyrimidinic endonuclease 1 n=1 Tax=Cryptococcus neoformans Tu259-1 TaxID=1230072 RepID=A0A854Q3X9_CRYNE|nr:AP endonuclease 1 [Cryptococcus neoformans var. grubii AD1-83a]OWZ53902.1 AP endonuclease 1 [Cryptococcus neoformans var. grubii 125.91]OXG09863.1 AP endonuclease 1 [Cryptococcus neoformans var. grubii Tu259-1]OXG42573.1 AP endonuclease 1 [Cryptococcus neoformans var. grubii MW-RSA1955]OXG47196.1 AP endonuclease 1 [Cryptococcus neoformans var. grubii CHC193]OXG56120.1 AP endonuclease 1 [Cryptococcus neoformans var. grubii c8]OXG75053.1 AP endonuclease 1 [Cryptococcus neoformans var. grubii